jgi:hypothetical protein
VFQGSAILVNYVEVVIGWKIAKELPSWVDDALAWEGFLFDIKNNGARPAGFPEDKYYDNVPSNSEKPVLKHNSVVNVEDNNQEEEESEYYDKETYDSDKEVEDQNAQVVQVQKGKN